jgi:hypothetical protein
MCDRLNASELRRRLLPRSGGQGVAGSNPAVPTQVSGHFRVSRGGLWASMGAQMGALFLGSAVNRVPGPRSGVNAQVSGVQGAQNRENA